MPEFGFLLFKATAIWKTKPLEDDEGKSDNTKIPWNV